MARPLRSKDPEIFRLITIRTVEARLWIRPSRCIRRLLGGIIARYQELCGIEIYAYCVLGNHFHLLIRAPRENTDEFCENVNKEIARRLNWLNRRRGKFWGRRYDDQHILSEDDVLEAFLYISSNPTRHGLVKNSFEWPGLNSAKQAVDERDRRFSFQHHSIGTGNVRTTHTLKLSILPQFAHLPKKERRTRVIGLLVARMKKIIEERRQQGLGFLGLERVQAQELGAIPHNVSNSPRPACYTKCRRSRKEFLLKERVRRQLYLEASWQFRLGRLDAVFPPFTFKPPLHRRPRTAPFTPVLEPVDSA